MKTFITFDYELFFGKESGSAEKCIIKPVNILREIAKKRNTKFIFFIDSGYLIKLVEYKNKFSYVKKEYDLVFKNIEELNKEGHDIQLHIHSHWEDSYFDGNKWVMNTKRFRLHDFEESEIKRIVYEYKKVLTDIIGEKVFAYRAGGWCIQPFEKLKIALKENNIWLDSTVFYGGYNKSDTHYYDYKKAPLKDIWKFENDVLIEEEQGFFMEIPISSIKLSPLFFWKFAITKKLMKGKMKIYGDGKPVGASKKDILKMLTTYTYSCVSCDGYKSILLNKAYQAYKEKNLKNFVVIGHPKGQSEFSLIMLDKLLAIQSKTYIFKDILYDINR